MTGLVLVAPLGASASAGWAVPAAGSAHAAGDTLSPPAALAAARTPEIRLSWSSQSWVGSHRVLRSTAPTGPWSQLADLPGNASGYDDPTTGAGSWSYRVEASTGSWQGASTVTAADPTYVLRATSAFTGTSCETSGARADMLQGHAPAGSGSTLLLTGTNTFCSDTWTAGQSVPAGTTTVVLFTTNTHASTACTFTALLSRNPGTTLDSTTVTVPAGRTLPASQAVTLSTPQVSFDSGDRLNLTVTSPNGCGSSQVHYDGATVPSRMTLPG